MIGQRLSSWVWAPGAGAQARAGADRAAGWRELLRGALPALAVLVAALLVGVVAADSPFLALVLPFGVAGAAVLLLVPELAVPLVMFIIWSHAAGVAAEHHGVPTVIAMGLPALLLLPLTRDLVFRREPLRFHPVMGLLLLYFAVQLLGAWGAINPSAAQSQLVTFAVEGMLVFFLIFNTVRTPRLLRLATWAAVLAGLFLGVISGYQQATGTFGDNYWGFSQVTAAAFGTGETTIEGEVEQSRLGGPLGDQNRHAQNMMLLAILALFLAWSERSPALRLLALAAAFFAALGTALTFSRGAAVAFVMVIAVMAVMRYIKLRHVAVVILGTALVMALLPQYTTRLTSLVALTAVADSDTEGVQGTDGATRGRLNEMLSAALVYADYPTLGVGPGQFRYHYLDYADRVGIRAHQKARESHSLFLGVAADSGTLGLGVFLAILAAVLLPLHRERQRWLATRPAFAALLGGYFMMVVTYIASGVFLHMAYERYFYSMLGLACAAVAISVAEARRDEDARGSGAGQISGGDAA